MLSSQRPRCTLLAETLVIIPVVTAMEYGALLPTSPHHHYVLDANGKPELVLGDEEVTSKETEMVNNEKAKKIFNQDDVTVK